MEGSRYGTLQDTQKSESSSEDKEVVVEVAADADERSPSDDQNADIVITDEKATQSEEKKEQIESGKVEDTEEGVSDAIQDAQVGNTQASDTVDLELKETELAPSEDNNEFSSVSGNEGLRENQVVVETFIEDMAVAEEEKNVLSSVVIDELLGESEEPNEIYGTSSLPLTDVASEETVDVETSIPILGECEKVTPTIIEKSLEPSVGEKVEEPSHVQEESSYESAKEESVQPSPNVTDAETTRAIVQEKIEFPTSTENPTIAPVTQEQRTFWNSCCGLLEIFRGW